MKSIDRSLLNIIYFDEAAKASRDYLKVSGTVRRGTYSISEKATQKWNDSYLNISKFLGFSSQELIFTNSKRYINILFKDGPFKIKDSNDFIDISTAIHRKNDFHSYSGIYLSGKVFGCYLDVIAVKKDILSTIEPFEVGGDMIIKVTKDSFISDELPYKFSAGTPDIASIIYLGRAIDLINISSDIDVIFNEFNTYLIDNKIDYEPYKYSSCFRIFDKNVLSILKVKDKYIDIYVPRSEPSKIFDMKGLFNEIK
jgi:selenocysteine lyase/cysteine desulfurase